MKYSSAAEIFEAFNHQRILIIGDVMVDSYVWGQVDRISPEAPVPVVHVKKRERRLGGAGNVARNINSMGSEPILCSIIGQDPEGDHFINLLKQQYMPEDGIIKSDSRKTTTKERFLSGSQHLLRVDEEQDHELSEKERSALKKNIQDLLPMVHAVVFEDYNKGLLDGDIIKFTIDLAKEMNIPTVVDPKRKNFLTYREATLFKPNLKEIREGLKIDLEKHDLEGLKKAVGRLKQILAIGNILVTLSELGVYCSSHDGDFHIPSHIRSISDVSGAGDTVTAIAALCMSLDLPPKFMAALCNLAGGLVCEQLGVVPVDKERLLRETRLHGIF